MFHLIRTYKYRIYPTKLQEQSILFIIERCRLLYNRLMEERKYSYEVEDISLTYNIQTATITERKRFIPELKQVYSQVLFNVAKRVDDTYLAFFERVKRGKKPGFPRFKSVSRYNSFTYPQSGYKIVGTKIRLSKVGDVRIKLHRQIIGTVKSCTIITKNKKYYACLMCDVEERTLARTNSQVGIDVGIKYLATSSDGEMFAAPNNLRKNENRLKNMQRKMARRTKNSRGYNSAKESLARLHEKVANSRKDYAHKLSRELVVRYDLIAFEKLTIKNITKNHNLAKSVVDAAWGMLITLTAYKAESAGKQSVCVIASGTSQQCSQCGETVPKKLRVRVHRCSCGYVADRDVNAAKNILKRGLKQLQ